MSGFVLKAGDLDRRIRIEQLARPAGRGKAGQETWTEVDTVWAQVQDMLPSRGERIAEGLAVSLRPARVRIRYRNDVTASMRIIHGSRVMQIISAPAELGRHVALEFVAQDFSTAGPGA